MKYIKKEKIALIFNDFWKIEQEIAEYVWYFPKKIQKKWAIEALLLLNKSA